MLSHLRSLENQLVERLKPDVLQEMNACYQVPFWYSLFVTQCCECWLQLPLNTEVEQQVIEASAKLSKADLDILTKGMTGMIRRTFSDHKEDSTYHAGRAKEMSVWDLVMYSEHPDDPDVYLADVEGLADVFEVHVMLCSMGPLLDIFRQVHTGDEDAQHI